MAMTIERELLARYLGDQGAYTEAENVREGIDLESYGNELRLIDWLRRHHITQPAQAVAWVEPDVIEAMQPDDDFDGADGVECVLLKEQGEKHTVPLYTRALAGEKAEDGLAARIRAELPRIRKATGVWVFDAGMHEACEKIAALLPTPPTDGEG
jgi:hypothetical protein